MILELPIFHHTDATRSAKDMGLNYELEDADIRPMTFYHVNALSPYFEDGKEYSSIHTNDSEYTCTMPYKAVREAILVAQKEPHTIHSWFKVP